MPTGDQLNILVDAPQALLEGARWLCARGGSFLTARSLRRLLHKTFAALPSAVKHHEFPRVSKISSDGRNWFLRLYWLPYLHTAAQYLWACRVARELGVTAPVVRQRCIARIGSHWCLAMIEEELGGAPVSEWTCELAADLGRGVAAWHSIKQVPAFMRLSRTGRSPTLGYAELLQRPPRGGLVFSRKQQTAIAAARSSLADEDFIGESAVSHGDLHPRNLLALTTGRVGWVDLDRVRLRPVWHDLAAAAFDLLRNVPEAIDAFEETYFRERPHGRSAWRRHRRRWFHLYSMLKAARFLTGRPVLPGQKDRTLEDRRYRAAVHFARAHAAAAVTDAGQSAGSLVQGILQRAKSEAGKAPPVPRPEPQHGKTCQSHQPTH